MVKTYEGFMKTTTLLPRNIKYFTEFAVWVKRTSAAFGGGVLTVILIIIVAHVVLMVKQQYLKI